MLVISTDFESGNIGRWVLEEPRKLRFEAPTDGAPWAMWFYFRMEGHESGPFEFIVGNLLQCLEATHWGDVRPVMRPVGGDWQRARDEDVVLDLDASEFSFRFDVPPTPVEIAYCYPYTPSLLSTFLGKLGELPGIEVTYPGQSEKGRPVPCVVLRCTDPAAQPVLLWAIVRTHAGEVSGSYVLEGFLHAVAHNSLRRCSEIHVLPMVDVDGVAEGRYGKDAPPADHWMCWTPNSPRIESRLGVDLMRHSVESGRPLRLLLDFHAPSPEDDSYIPPLNPTLMNEEQRVRAEHLVNALVSNSPADLSISADKMLYQRIAPWFADDIEHTPEAFALQQFGAESCLIETAYFASRTGTPFNPEAWRRYGAALAAGLEKYLLGVSPGRIGIYDSMPPVYRQTHGWVLWIVPQFVRATFSATTAWAVGDDPSAQVYFGAPRLYMPGEAEQLLVRGGTGGTLQIVWTFYDSSGARLFPGRVEQALSPSSKLHQTRPPDALPVGTALLRPNFRLSGSFRPFEIDLGIPS